MPRTFVPTIGCLAITLVSASQPTRPPAQVPWAPGEDLQYTVKFLGIKSGTGSILVPSIDTVRGHAAWQFRLNIKGSALFGSYHVDDSIASWMDIESLNSLHFEERLYEGGKHTTRLYDFFPERAVLFQEGKGERPSVADPLDYASFLFFVRTLQLEVGRDYTFPRYFDPNGNPVVIKVLRKDTIDVPAGRFPTIVLQPVIKTAALFSQNGHAELWLSDDEHRVLVQMKTHFAKIVSLELQLKKATFK